MSALLLVAGPGMAQSPAWLLSTTSADPTVVEFQNGGNPAPLLHDIPAIGQGYFVANSAWEGKELQFAGRRPGSARVPVRGSSGRTAVTIRSAISIPTNPASCPTW